MTYSLMESTRRSLSALAVSAQRRSRTPALAAGVAHRGELLWDIGVGTADLSDRSVPLGSDTQFLVASNTKTFTAVMVMQLRDEGRLSLDDTIDAILPGSEHPLTVRQLLSHTGGIQREPVGEMWDPPLEGPDPADTIENWNRAERVLSPRRQWHYSNLAYMVLGELIAHLDGRSWSDSLTVRLLEPLELHRTTTSLVAPSAGLYYVPEFSDVPLEEPIVFTDTTLPAGGLASTVSDLARWHAFLMDPDASVLRPDTAEEMRHPQATVDRNWESAYGLGFFLVRKDGRIWFGHTGGAPGGISGVFSHAESRTTAVLLTNQTSAKDPAGTAVALGSYVLANDPAPQEPWEPGTEVPDELRDILGVWFSEGNPGIFAVRQGQLVVRGLQDGEATPPTVFEREAADVYRATTGLERGERLVIHRRADGSVWQINWVTYRWTREPLGFGQVNPAKPD